MTPITEKEVKKFMKICDEFENSFMETTKKARKLAPEAEVSIIRIILDLCIVKAYEWEGNSAVKTSEKLQMWIDETVQIIEIREKEKERLENLFKKHMSNLGFTVKKVKEDDNK